MSFFYILKKCFRGQVYKPGEVYYIEQRDWNMMDRFRVMVKTGQAQPAEISPDYFAKLGWMPPDETRGIPQVTKWPASAFEVDAAPVAPETPAAPASIEAAPTPPEAQDDTSRRNDDPSEPATRQTKPAKPKTRKREKAVRKPEEVR